MSQGILRIEKSERRRSGNSTNSQQKSAGWRALERANVDLSLFLSNAQIDEDIAKIGSPLGDIVGSPDDEEMLTARLDMADYKFSFHEKAREYNPAWMSPEGQFSWLTFSTSPQGPALSSR